jgi:hypothetical protein
MNILFITNPHNGKSGYTFCCSSYYFLFSGCGAVSTSERYETTITGKTISEVKVKS